ncbi:MAG: hypothetical protein ACRCY3_10785 [Sphingorhabdus sp.]
MMDMATKGQEPVLKQLRMAWWRDQLSKDAQHRPGGEPMFARLAILQSEFNVSLHMLNLVDAWETLCTGHKDEAEDKHRFYRLRSEAVFGSYAVWNKATPRQYEAALTIGKLWAEASMGGICTNDARQKRSSFKPLNLLWLSALLENDGTRQKSRNAIRFYWHALTGF